MLGHLAPERLIELVRAGAERALRMSEDGLEEMRDVVAVALGERDPMMLGEIHRANQLNLMQWITSCLQRPGRPVSLDLTDEMRRQARYYARRGRAEDALAAWRAGQQVAWRRWIEIAFSVSEDPREVRGLLEASAGLIGNYMDAILSGLAEEMRREQDELARGTPIERRDLVSMILDHQAVDRQLAERRLGFRFDRPLQAVILWKTVGEPDIDLLDAAAVAFMTEVGSVGFLKVSPHRGELWLWVSPAIAKDKLPSLAPSLRAAVGSVDSGLAGFIRSHEKADSVRRLMIANPASPLVACYADVRPLILMTADTATLDRYVREVLGSLVEGEPKLRRILRAHLQLGHNIARTASRLGMHRNTLARSLSRAEDLLPSTQPMGWVEIALALEIHAWQHARDDAECPVRD